MKEIEEKCRIRKEEEDRKSELLAEYHRLEGYSNAIHDYGIWNSGKQTIGCQGRPVREIDQKLQKQKDLILKDLEALIPKDDND